jgi:hypothetical protein
LRIQQAIFTTDGEYAGTLKVLTGKYNVGGHRAILLKKDTNTLSGQRAINL